MDFILNDCTSDEIQNNSLPVIETGLTRRINTCSYMLVLISSYTNSRHRDAVEIGYKNWKNFKIPNAKAAGLKFVGIKLESSNDSPEEIFGIKASWTGVFSRESIIGVLKNA